MMKEESRKGENNWRWCIEEVERGERNREIKTTLNQSVFLLRSLFVNHPLFLLPPFSLTINWVSFLRYHWPFTSFDPSFCLLPSTSFPSSPPPSRVCRTIALWWLRTEYFHKKAALQMLRSHFFKFHTRVKWWLKRSGKGLKVFETEGNWSPSNYDRRWELI